MTRSNMCPSQVRRFRAFTLVELLVVIGIIALLISVLLPSLNKARRAANTIKCAANLHSIMLAFQIYGTQNNGYLLGSPLTTGFGNGTAADSNQYTPYTIQSTDWMTPVMEIQGIKVPYSAAADVGHANGQARWDRVSAQLNNPGFRCPENDILIPLQTPASIFPASNAPAVAQYESYCTSWVFFLQNLNAPTPAAITVGNNLTNAYAFPPANYAPKFSRIGAGNNKICVSDGGRYVNFASGAFDITYNESGSQGGAYADYGPWSPFANGRQRTQSPSFLPAAKRVGDDRVLWARHGVRVTGAPDSQFRFNAGFFDGHVETMSVDTALDPNYWGPKGSEFSIKASGGSPTGQFSQDVYNRFVAGQGNLSSDGNYYVLPK